MGTCKLWAPALCLLVALTPAVGAAQENRAPSSIPKIDVQEYSIEATLIPESHELKAVSGISFRVLESTDVVVFDISENLSVNKVTGPQGAEVEFGQDEIGPGLLSVRFPKPLAADSLQTIKVEYSGGFDRDRYSRMFARDDSGAYIGPEGSYLMYSAKWFPVNQFLLDRAAMKLEITVPLGFTVVGPGVQLPVVTKGITETFGWTTKLPIVSGSIVAGRYFEKKVQSGKFTIECFAREDHLNAVQKHAEAAGKILEYYEKTFGPAPAGYSFKLVEVDDRLETQTGALGTVFVTHAELADTTAPMREMARRIAHQWVQERIGVQSTGDLWLIDGLAYYAAALYMGQNPAAFKEEINNLAVLSLKFESKSAVRNGFGLGYRTEPYESVVAGKGAWIFHMLRELVGEAQFNQLIKDFLRSAADKAASTQRFQQMTEKLYGKELAWFFAEWVDTIGVPTLDADYVVYKTRNGFKVAGALKQDRDLFRMPVEVHVVTPGKTEKKQVDLNGRSTPFEISTFSFPSQVVIDPDHKVLRDSKELRLSVQLSMGADLKRKGEYVEAVRAFEEALKLSPRSSMAHFRLAEVLYEQHNLQSAANSFREALNGDKEPKWIEVWSYIYLGKIYDILGQRQRAMAEYNKALNTKDDTHGAQAEAKKWLSAPFTKEQQNSTKEAKS